MRNKSFDYRKAASAIAMALLVVSVSFSCMVGVEGNASAQDGINSDPSEAGNTNVTIPGSSVESFNSPIEPTLSSFDDLVPQSYMTKEPYGICYWTPYGVYIFNESSPEKMSLTSLNGTRLVEESFFTVMADGAAFDILGGKIVSAVDERLEVEYSLNDVSSKIAWNMTVVYDFIDGEKPKITASVVVPEDETKEWNVAWVIVPGKDAAVDESDARWAGASLKEVVGKRSSAPDLNISLNIGSEKLTVDWSDAGEGALSVARHDAKSKGVSEEEGRSLVITFREGEEVIDPTMVGEAANDKATGFACQRKVFWYDNLYWLFYNSGTEICYRYSADGTAWSIETRMPDGTSPGSNSGFDVAFRNGNLMIGWCDASSTVYVKKGTVVGATIQWSYRIMISPNAEEQCNLQNPVSVAIGDDGAYWIAYSYFTDYSSAAYVDVLKADNYEQGRFYPSYRQLETWGESDDAWNAVLLPTGAGGMVLLETGYPALNGLNGCVRVSYLLREMTSWVGPDGHELMMSSGSSPLYKSTQFSAVASSDGTVHIAYVGINGYIRYAAIGLDGSRSLSDIVYGGYSPDSYSPTICLDSIGTLHISYISHLSEGRYDLSIQHYQKHAGSGSWSGETLCYLEGMFETNAYSLTSWAKPTGTLAFAWTSDYMGSWYSVNFASIPLPFGASGYSSDPWSRDGLSPYGTYFAMNGQYISPGSGSLTLVQQDVSVAGRGGVDLEISRIYQQPKYFSSDGSPYDYKAFPFCNLGQHWSLDLPWMDDYYVYLGNGQRFIIQWGNEGDVKEFVNHDGVHFVLRDVNKSGNQYYELITSTGIRYQFEHSSPYRLTSISDLTNYGPEGTAYTIPLNRLNLSYSNDRLASITDSALSRSIIFHYNSNGLLSSIDRPDGEPISYAYAQYSGRWFLTAVIDADDRETTFTYDSGNSYCLGSITYPSGGKVQYTYGIDQTPATEVFSRLVTSESIRNAVTNALIRQTSFEYKIVNGKVTYCKLINYDETGSVQGSNVYIFHSALKSSSEIVLGPAGQQMQKTTTWYDASGQPSRVDTYSGSSTEVSYSEYMAYDDWGNVIFTRDALGHESYYSYANTDTQNSFQGGTVLERTSSGKIFHDPFDDWDLSDWTVDTGAGTVQLDGTADPARAPSVELTSTKSGSLSASHHFAEQSGNFNIQTSFRSQGNNHVMVMSGSVVRINFESEWGLFKYYDGSVWLTVAECEYNTWYDIGFAVDYGSNTYDIYINGWLAESNAPLLGSGPLNSITFQARSVGGSNTLWFDDVQIYKSNTVTVNGMESGDIVELYNSRGELLDRSKSGTLTIPAFSWLSLPAYIKLLKVGDTSITTPMMDIWGGDTYSIADGTFITSIDEYSDGLSQSWNSIADDDWPAGSIIYDFDQGFSWVADHDYAASGNRYMQSGYDMAVRNNGYGFKSTTTSCMHVGHASDAIVQSIWLEEGKMPQEIVLQYFVNDVWKRAYWGGYANGNDAFIRGTPAELEPLAQNVHRIGDVPQTTGKWIQLVVKASDLGIPDGSDIYGIYYGLRGGTAKWDHSNVYGLGIKVDGVSSGMTVKMTLEDGTTVSKVASSSSVTLDLYSAGIRVFPVSASFEIFSGSTLIYASPVYDEIYNYDKFRYEGTSFYPNEIKSGLHSNPVGTLTYQDDGGTVSQESYVSYNRDGRPTATKSRLGPSWACTESSYDIYGNLVSSTDASGVRTYTVYDSSGTYVALQGKAIQMHQREMTFYSYDDRTGLMLSTKDAYDHETSYQYDALGRTIRTNNPDGTHTSIAYDDENNKATYYDELGRKTVSYYDVIGRLIKVESYGLSSAPYSQVTYKYNWQDLPVRIVDEMGRVTEYTYDYLGRQTSTAASGGTAGPDTVSEDFENTGAWSFSKGSMNGNVNWLIGQYSTSRSTSPTTSMELGFTSGPMSYDSGSSAAWKDYDVGEIDEISVKMYVSEWTHDGRQWDWLESGIRLRLYDGSGNDYATYTYWLSCWYKATDNHTAPNDNTKIVYGKPAMNTWLNVVLHPSDDWNIDWSDCSRVRVELYVYGSGTNADKFTVNYDDLKIKSAGGVAGSAISYTQYDDVNRLVTYIDELGHKTVMKYDVLGRLNATREYHSSSAYYETLMTYDAAGNLKTVRQANGEMTRMHYDTLGRQTSIQYPDGYSESWTYDNAGKVLTSTSRSGLVTESTYDIFGYLTSVSSRDDAIATSYDLKGRIVEKSNGLGSITYLYDGMDRVIEMTEIVDGVPFTLSYQYNSVGNLLHVDYPDSSRVSYVYDDLDRLIDIMTGGTQLLHLTYNLDGSVATETYCGGNSVVSYAYNERGWVSSISAEDRSGTDLLGLRYTYDAAGNVLKIRDVVGSAGMEDYQYDALGRLTKATGAWGSIQYGYDSVGNRLWKNENGNHETYTYEAYNRLTYGGNWVYYHDPDGNVVEKLFINPVISYSYEYNSFGQMTAVTEGMYGEVIGEYSYDANGARSMVEDASGTSRSVYSGHDPVYEVAADGTVSKYVYANGRLALRIVDGTENNCYISDALGSTRLVLKNGNAGSQDILFSAVTYKPFGAVYSSTGSDPVTFAGETVDDTGLVYLFARYYDPELGRFYALDPELGSLSMPQTLNRYLYCINSPLIHTDPTGRFLNFVVQAVVGAAVGAVVGGVIAAATGQDILAGAAGGAVAGAISFATMGLVSPIVGGLIAGAASGAVSGGIVAAKESGGDLMKIVEGALVGSAFGALTGAVGGATLGRLLGPHALPSGKIVGGINAAQTIGKSSGTYLAGLKTSPIATKEGITEGVELMAAQTAKDLGKCIGWSTVFSAQRTYNSILGKSMSEGAGFMFEQWQRAKSYH